MGDRERPRLPLSCPAGDRDPAGLCLQTLGASYGSPPGPRRRHTDHGRLWHSPTAQLPHSRPRVSRKFSASRRQIAQ